VSQDGEVIHGQEVRTLLWHLDLPVSIMTKSVVQLLEVRLIVKYQRVARLHRQEKEYEEVHEVDRRHCHHHRSPLHPHLHPRHDLAEANQISFEYFSRVKLPIDISQRQLTELSCLV